MKLAPLQLSDYYLTDLTLQANPEFDTSAPADDCVETLQVIPHYSQAKDNGEKGTEWLVSLEISQTIPGGGNLPYAFSLRIQGTVSASPHLDGVKLQRAMHANGPAMLFGAAREIIRAATGRGPWPAVIIPSTNFLANLPPLEAPAKMEETASSPVKKAAAKKAVAKRTSTRRPKP
jgi:preprotein translocase subunit SecB